MARGLARCAAVIGVGRMGAAMARRLAGQGFSLVLWNRTRSRAERVAGEVGGVVAESPRDAARRCPESVHIVVSDDTASLEVLAGSNGVFYAGTSVTVYNHSTVSVSHSMWAVGEAERRGVRYVEAPVAGGPRQAATGRLLVLLAARGGCPVSEAVKALGEPVCLGEPPAATAAKLAFNTSFLGIVASLAEAFALVEAYGVDHHVFIERVLAKTWLRSIVERYGERLWPRGEASFEARWAGKDARYAAWALQEKGLPGALAGAIASYYALMAGEGAGGEDYPSIAGFFAGYARRRAKGGG